MRRRKREVETMMENCYKRESERERGDERVQGLVDYNSR